MVSRPTATNPINAFAQNLKAPISFYISEMNEAYQQSPASFFTATIYEWKNVLADDKNKNIIIESLQFLVTKKRIELNAFVIMKNHIHLIWQPINNFTYSQIQASFMKFTAQQLKRSMMEGDNNLVLSLKVNKHDRDYQIWKRESLSVDLLNERMFIQKLEYIHYNPVTAGLCQLPEDYFYSSARFYFNGSNDFNMLTHYSGN